MFVFSSLNEALARGFVLALKKQYMSYRGCSIIGFDTSAQTRMGQSYGLRVEVPEEYTSNYLGAMSRIFGASQEVKLPVKPAALGGGGSGSAFGGRTNPSTNVIHMFAPDVFDAAVVAAQAWTDQWMVAHPEAIKRFQTAQARERKAERVSM